MQNIIGIWLLHLDGENEKTYSRALPKSSPSWSDLPHPNYRPPTFTQTITDKPSQYWLTAFSSSWITSYPENLNVNFDFWHRNLF